MDSNEEYIKHNTGIWGLYQFLDAYLSHGYKYEIKSHCIIELSSFYSQHIGFGNTNSKKLGKNLFFAFSSQVFDFLRLISLDKIMISPLEQRVYLVSSKIVGDKNRWPDIAPFCLSFYVEDMQKIEVFMKEKFIDIKSYSFQDKELVVEHKKTFKLKSALMKKEDVVLSDDALYVDDYFNIMSRQINSNIDKYNDGHIPVFKGDYVEGEMHRELRERRVFDDPKQK